MADGEGGALEAFLGRCREVAAQSEAPTPRLEVLARVAAELGRCLGVELSAQTVALLAHDNVDLDLRVSDLPLASRRPELLSVVCDALLDSPQRRKAGAWYTPSVVAEHIASEAIAAVETEPPWTVCDPACGGGAFLLAAARRLEGRGMAPRQIVEDLLFGCDLDSEAVQVARAALFLFGSRAGEPPPRRCNVVRGDSLIGFVSEDLDAWFDEEDEQLGLFGPEKPAKAEGNGYLRQLDAWTALALWPDGVPPDMSEALAEAAVGDGPIWSAVRAVSEELGVIHWSQLCPSGFDVLVGNPPFLNQLESQTTRTRGSDAVLRHLISGKATGYADSAVMFLALAKVLCRPGGTFGMVLPESVLASRDAGPVREALQRDARMVWAWRGVDRVFSASVRVWAPLFVNHQPPACHSIDRAAGLDFDALPALESQVLPTWSWLFADTLGVPSFELPATDRLGAICSATADFRDQFYGLVPFVRDAAATGLAATERQLLTVGLIDPARSLWGIRGTRFAKQAFARPVVDLEELASAPALERWAQSRLVPKLLLSTQTRVLEVFADHEGCVLPSIPTVSITSHDGRLDHLGAALSSPVLTAWALRHFAGAALSGDAIKLSAAQVLELPAPAVGESWDRGASAFRRASRSLNSDDWLRAMDDLAGAMCLAYGLTEADSGPVINWWRSRLPDWDRRANLDDTD